MCKFCALSHVISAQFGKDKKGMCAGAPKDKTLAKLYVTNTVPVQTNSILIRISYEDPEQGNKQNTDLCVLLTIGTFDTISSASCYPMSILP